MKLLSSYIFRALCTMLIGFLLISRTEQMPTLLVQIIGGLFMFSGVVAIIGYFVSSHQHNRRVRKALETGDEAPSQSGFVPVFPVVGIGSLAFGAFLLLMPAQFVSILIYVLGILLILAGCMQCYSLIRFRKLVPITWSVFILPLLILAAGIYVVCQPKESSSVTFTILGVACICYGAAEFFNGLRLHRYQKRLAKAEAEAAAEAARQAELEAQMQEAEEVSYEEIEEAEIVEENEAESETEPVAETESEAEPVVEAEAEAMADAGEPSVAEPEGDEPSADKVIVIDGGEDA